MSENYRKPIVKTLMLKGKDGDGKGISSISKTSTSGLVDTYTIALTDGTKSTFTVTNGAKGDKGDTGLQGQQGVKGQDGQSIKEITKTSTSGLTDTYEISLTDGTKKSFTVSNGKGIKSIAKTSTSGLTDTYTITYNDDTKSTFTVKNGDSAKEWKKVKVFEDLTKESSVTFDEPYTELIIISENLKGENGSQLIKHLNNKFVGGQNNDISSTTEYNCVDFIECIADGIVKAAHMQKQQYSISTVGVISCGIFNIGVSEITSLRLSPQYKTFTSGKATVYAR